MTKCTLAHVHCEWRNMISIYGIQSVTSTVWFMELRLLSFCYSTILCKQQNQGQLRTCTWVSSSILSHLSYYSFIKLHDHNFKAIVWLWTPFHRHFVHFRRKWDSKASIINAFTTFLLLSFSKILFVSFTLLHSISIYDNHHGNSRCVLYYDPTVECYTLEYSILSALTVCVLVILIICPTILLILYPTRLFRKCISYCGFCRWLASFLVLRILYLTIFMNTHH